MSRRVLTLLSLFVGGVSFGVNIHRHHWWTVGVVGLLLAFSLLIEWRRLRPQFVRDGSGLHFCCGGWMVSRTHGVGFWGFDHVTRHANLGATQIDVWFGFGLRLERVQRQP